MTAVLAAGESDPDGRGRVAGDAAWRADWERRRYTGSGARGGVESRQRGAGAASRTVCSGSRTGQQDVRIEGQGE